MRATALDTRRLRADAVVSRILESASVAHASELDRGLTHAYASLLGAEELCDAALETLDAPEPARRAIRNRLIRLAGEDKARAQLDALGQDLLELRPEDYRMRLRVDALLSQLYQYVGPPIRQAVLERWLDRGTSGCAARWTKAIATDQLLLSVDSVLSVWRRWRFPAAAKLLVNHAPISLLREILPELVQWHSEGWLISQAVRRCGELPEETWAEIRAAFPATYAYLCAKTGRKLSEDDAFAIVTDCDGLSRDRGLALWSIGQLGLWRVLERVREHRADIRDEDLARIGVLRPTGEQEQGLSLQALFD